MPPEPEGGTECHTRCAASWFFLAAGALAITSLSADTGKRRAAGPTTGAPAPEKKFVASELEYYLTDDGVAYIRPGLNIKVNSITIGSDRKPVVELTLTDNMNQPLDRLGQVTPGPISLSFILAAWNPDTREYTSYTTRTATAAIVPLARNAAGAAKKPAAIITPPIISIRPPKNPRVMSAAGALSPGKPKSFCVPWKTKSRPAKKRNNE